MNCSVCNNKRKVEYEGHIETCPVCEDYVDSEQKQKPIIRKKRKRNKKRNKQINK